VNTGVRHVSSALIPLADGDIQNQLGIALDCNERLTVTEAGIMLGGARFLFASDEAPNFIRLYVLHRHITELITQ
jgi:hypothetical protein